MILAGGTDGVFHVREKLLVMQLEKHCDWRRFVPEGDENACFCGIGLGKNWRA
jgi:hypothetical protein